MTRQPLLASDSNPAFAVAIAADFEDSPRGSAVLWVALLPTMFVYFMALGMYAIQPHTLTGWAGTIGFGYVCGLASTISMVIWLTIGPGSAQR